ncbi:uncharacterized protein LOC144238770 isoform X2 [Crocuta crocuta]
MTAGCGETAPELMARAAVSSCNHRRKVRRIRYINPDISDPENQGQLFLTSRGQRRTMPSSSMEADPRGSSPGSK